MVPALGQPYGGHASSWSRLRSTYHPLQPLPSVRHLTILGGQNKSWVVSLWPHIQEGQQEYEDPLHSSPPVSPHSTILLLAWGIWSLEKGRTYWALLLWRDRPGRMKAAHLPNSAGFRHLSSLSHHTPLSEATHMSQWSIGLVSTPLCVTPWHSQSLACDNTY